LAEALDLVQEELSGRGVELRRRLVQEQELRLERESGGEADPLEFAAGELGCPAVPEVGRVYALERRVDARPDGRRLDAEVLEAESDLIRDERHDDLVFRILKDARHLTGEVRRSHLPRVAAADVHPAREAAAVEVRGESRQGSKESRLPGARRAEESDDLTRVELEGHAQESGDGSARIRERQGMDVG
jgi:hypothetical protein